jgi:hypothetical protein
MIFNKSTESREAALLEAPYYLSYRFTHFSKKEVIPILFGVLNPDSVALHPGYI